MVEALFWISNLLTGTVAVSIATLAVAFTGISMLRGRVPYQRGAMVVIGCFIVFGARFVAEGLSGLTDHPTEPVISRTSVDQPPLFAAPDTGDRRNDLYPGAAIPDATSSVGEGGVR